jgi:hypothetical protein
MLTQSHRKPGATVLGWSMLEWFAVAMAGFSAWTLGCSASKPPCPPPIEPENEYTLLCEHEDEIVPIEANDLGVPPAAIMKPGRNDLDAEPSTGRFPCGLSVARVNATGHADEPEHTLQLVSAGDYHDAPWIRAMQDLPMVREVTMLGNYGLDPRGTDWRRFLQLSLHVECDLCFLYAEVLETGADAEFVGVLWDAVAEKALAAYRVPAVIPWGDRLVYEEKKQYLGLRSDAEGRAMAELRHLVRNTILDIAGRDSESDIRPNPWKTDMPLLPRDSRSDMRIFLKERPQK